LSDASLKVHESYSVSKSVMTNVIVNCHERGRWLITLIVPVIYLVTLSVTLFDSETE
jgi:hypothetical protein